MTLPQGRASGTSRPVPCATRDALPTSSRGTAQDSPGVARRILAGANSVQVEQLAEQRTGIVAQRFVIERLGEAARIAHRFLNVIFHFDPTPHA